jgi:hypothetical protein
MNEFKLARESLQLVQKDLGLEDNILFEGQSDPFERLLEYLEKAIKFKLDNDFAGLLNAMYRIDIPEDQLKALLSMTKPEEMSNAIAQAIIEREKQKVLTRQQYRKS